MKGVWVIVAFLLIAVTSAGQHYKPPRGSPDEVLDKYYAMINEGALLTPEGWEKAAALFVYQSPAPRNATIFVTTEFPIGNGPMSTKGTHAEAWEKWVDDLGTIDSTLCFHAPPKPAVPLEGVFHILKLVRTDKRWKIGANGQSEEEVTEVPEWRIEGSLESRSVSREAAIRWLKQMRETTSDPDLAANATKTIAILGRLPAPRGHI
jgi:hypothetical protein